MSFGTRKELIISTFFGFLNVNAQVHVLAYHAVRLVGCVSFVTYYLIVLCGINKAPHTDIQTAAHLVGNGRVQETEG